MDKYKVFVYKNSDIKEPISFNAEFFEKTTKQSDRVFIEMLETYSKHNYSVHGYRILENGHLSILKQFINEKYNHGIA